MRLQNKTSNARHDNVTVCARKLLVNQVLLGMMLIHMEEGVILLIMTHFYKFKCILEQLSCNLHLGTFPAIFYIYIYSCSVYRTWDRIEFSGIRPWQSLCGWPYVFFVSIKFIHALITTQHE